MFNRFKKRIHDDSDKFNDVRKRRKDKQEEKSSDKSRIETAKENTEKKKGSAPDNTKNLYHSIASEVEVLNEIKDIRDELNIIRRVMEDQDSIWKRLSALYVDADWMKSHLFNYYEDRNGLEDRIREVSRMDAEAYRTYVSVSETQGSTHSCRHLNNIC